MFDTFMGIVAQVIYGVAQILKLDGKMTEYDWFVRILSYLPQA